MARYEQLPIYKKALELIVFLEKAVRQFSRYHKYSIGERLRQTSWDVITMVVRANNTPVSERRELLVSLRDKIEEVSIALTVAKELGAFSNHNSWQQAGAEGDRDGVPALPLEREAPSGAPDGPVRPGEGYMRTRQDDFDVALSHANESRT